MKKVFLYIFSGTTLLITSCSFTENFNNINSSKDKLLLEIIDYLIQKEHYTKKSIDDEFSKKIFDDYLNALDPFKRIFTLSDIQKLKKYRKKIDDQFRDTNLSFFEAAYTLFSEKRKKVKQIYKEILNTPYDFTKDEVIYVNYDSLPYTKNIKALKERWRKQLKMMTLFSLASSIKGEKSKTVENHKSIDSLKKEAKTSIEESLNEMENFKDQMEESDWFVIYLNTILEEYDPHSYYFDPEKKNLFDTGMSGKFEGIGARLFKKGNKVHIDEIILGGPAWKSKKLEAGDLILKVAQNPNQTPVNIGSMRLKDAIKLIKGPKNTTVYLTIKHVDSKIEVIPILRDIVNLEETYLKTALLDTKQGKVAVVRLPKFYVDFNDYKKERNAASDMEKELKRLKNIDAKGLIIDLRNNGGGSLKTVVDIAGLFIPKGPVVQVNSSNGNKTVLRDKNPKIQWDKPLIIIVNELSASASEILAAAMQDYKRAIILGSRHTYGKGSVQNLIDLNLIIKNNNFGDLGALKLTTQKFYRITGGSTQLKGVQSDVVLPDKRSYMKIGERQQDSAMPWDKISPAEYTPFDNTKLFNQIIANSNERIEENNYFRLIDEKAQYIKKQQNDNIYTLNLKNYKKEIEQKETYTKKFKILDDYKNHLSFNSMPYELEKAKKDTFLLSKSKNWHKNLSRDFYIEESVNILKELIKNTTNSK